MDLLSFSGHEGPLVDVMGRPRAKGTRKQVVWHRHSLLARLGLVAIIAVAGAVDWARPTTAASQSSTLSPGNFTFNMTFGGQSRSFNLHVPGSYTGRFPVPLVLDLHGLGSNATQQAYISGFREKSDKVGFLVAYPQGIGGSWNAYGCCGTADLSNIDDVGFLKAVVNQIASMGKINHSRVYITGLSNGDKDKCQDCQRDQDLEQSETRNSAKRFGLLCWYCTQHVHYLAARPPRLLAGWRSGIGLPQLLLVHHHPQGLKVHRFLSTAAKPTDADPHTIEPTGEFFLLFERLNLRGPTESPAELPRVG